MSESHPKADIIPPQEYATQRVYFADLAMQHDPYSESIPATLIYDQVDPYAVTVMFEPGDSAPISWDFSRDILIEGLVTASGIGDVSASSYTDHRTGKDMFMLSLNSPGGSASYVTPRFEVADFAERMQKITPPGTEDRHIDWDKIISQIIE